MDKPASKHRKKLNVQQLEVLELLYKFRFGTNDLFAQYFGKKDRSFVYKRLAILQEQGLVGKRFKPSYRLQGKPAAYYLTPDGARALQAHKPDRPIHTKAIYKDKTLSEEFVDSCLRVFGIYCRLKADYGDNLKFITRVQLSNYDYFSEFTPAAYIRLDLDGTEKDFFLEYWQNTKPFFTFLRRLKQYSNYFDGGEWEDGTDSEFPPVLLICDTPGLQRRLMKKSDGVLEDASDHLKFYVATEDEIKQSKNALWLRLGDHDESLTLSQI
jgi:hypothetical protein